MRLESKQHSEAVIFPGQSIGLGSPARQFEIASGKGFHRLRQFAFAAQQQRLIGQGSGKQPGYRQIGIEEIVDQPGPRRRQQQENRQQANRQPEQQHRSRLPVADVDVFAPP
ncbi:hypothetical protein SDC9_82987 [bioreactor metagenome]|uniref:Uncharacterized protein n=1 Tax=bioreactor metagenome TaxID=1076179 RepID=A0A644Z8S0_9ZZZZ